MASAKRTMTLNLSDADMALLEELCMKKDLSKTALVRQALRLYQMVDYRMSVGEKMFFENDKTRAKAEVMVI